MNIQLSEHFSYKKLLRFTISSVIMLIFTSIYGVVDGIFVSNFVGKTPFAAVNIVFPVLMIFGALGFMMGTGGCALIAKMMGEGNHKKANRTFSLIIYTSAITGIIISVIGFIFIEQICTLLGAEGEILEYCVLYGRIILPFTTAFILQNEFQSFLVAAEKPQFGLFITVLAGVTNIVLDALFVAVFRWGLTGAAFATGLSQLVGGVIPLLYFIFSKKSILRLGGCKIDVRSLIKCCTNGSSEMMTNISMSLVNILYNFQLMKFAGEDGVAAYGVIMYVSFVFVAAFIGFSVGSAPIISYHYGAENTEELKNLRKKSSVIIFAASLGMFILAIVLSYPLASIFVGYDDILFELTRNAFIIYSISFLFSGFNIFGSAFFTALNNGGVSATLSFLRTLLFQVVSVLLLPVFFGINGIWFSVVTAELSAFIMTIMFITGLKSKYNY